MSEEQSQIPTLIIDGYGFVFRAYHVQPPLTSPNGDPVGALYGFTSMLIKLINDFRPSKCAMVFDAKGKNFRHDLYPEYKAHRPPAPEDLVSQLPLVRKAAEVLNFKIFEQEGVEADDVIATLATKLSKEGEKIVIVSSDKDLMQLVSDNVIMYDPIKSKYIDSVAVFEKFGVEPQKVRDALTLIGDSSDNIPGAPGIGPKSAAELVSEFGNITNLIESAEQIKQERRKNIILENTDQIKISYELVGLKDNLEIENHKDLSWSRPDREPLSKFIANYGFKSLISRAEKLFGMDLDHNPSEENKVNVIVKQISSSEELDYLLSKAYNKGFLAVFIDQNKQLNLAVDNKYHYFINEGLDPLPPQTDLFSLRPSNISLEKLFAVFGDVGVKKITFDLKYHMHFFKSLKQNATFEAFEDLALMHYATSAGHNQQDRKSFIELTPIADFIETYKEYLQNLKENSAISLYYDTDLPICYVLYKMEKNGVKIDQALLATMSKDFAKELKIIEKDIYSKAGTEFNVGSPKQLGEILFEKMQLPSGKMSKKSKTYSTSAEVLENLSEAGFDIADSILRWRSLSKLKSTYTDALPKQINKTSLRIHTTFNQNLTATSRLSSSEPNLQNIPIRTKEGALIRNAFIVEKGSKLIAADYSQIELRLLCHMSDTPELKKAFEEGQDIHTATASDIFKIPMNEVNSEHRRKAKAINFGIIYGISAFGLAKQINVSKQEAGEYIDLYFEKYPGIKKYMEDTKKSAHENEYVQNIFGRKLLLPQINHKNYAIRSFAERAAINAPLQSANADIIKLAMVKIAKILEKRNLKTKIILQIHDELLFEVPEEEIKTISNLIKKEMQNIVTLNIPLIVDVKIGDNWGEMEKL